MAKNMQPIPSVAKLWAFLLPLWVMRRKHQSQPWRPDEKEKERVCSCSLLRSKRSNLFMVSWRSQFRIL